MILGLFLVLVKPSYAQGFTEYNPSFNNKFSFMYGVNSSLTKAGDLSGFTLGYARKLDGFWLDANFQSSTGLFSKFSANNPLATQATDEELMDQKNTLSSFGIGIGIETQYFQELFSTKNLYEYIATNLAYYSYKEDYSGKSFTGPGLHAKFQIDKRFNNYLAAGINLNYHLAMVKREQEHDEEKSSDRNLTIGYMTLGFHLNFYL